MARKTPSPAPETAPGSVPETTANVVEQAAPNVLERVAITSGQIQQWFENHGLDDEQAQRVERIRQAGAAFAQIIRDNSPNCADQTAALRKVREAVFTANAAVALRGR